jgi:hypothetical protein
LEATDAGNSNGEVSLDAGLENSEFSLQRAQSEVSDPQIAVYRPSYTYDCVEKSLN